MAKSENDDGPGTTRTAATLRTFVAAYPSDAQREAVAAVIDRLARELRGGTRGAEDGASRRSARDGSRAKGPVRWVPMEQVHLTLAFLGEVPTERLDALAERLREAAGSVAPFTVSYHGVGAFPDRGRPRVVWLGVEQGAEPLGQLASAAREASRATGLEIDPKPFRPHLTLGRVRERTGASARGEVARALDAAPQDVGSGPAVLREIVLVTSRPGPGGHRHERVARLPLTAPEGD